MQDVILVKEQTVLDTFSSKNGLDCVLREAHILVGNFTHDMSTAASRAKTASLASNVAKLKGRVDALGKGLVSDWKVKSRAVDQNRKLLRDELDALKVIARRPLSDWEDEKEKIRVEEEAKIAAQKLKDEIEYLHEIALLLNKEYDRLQAEKKEKIEAERIAKEKEMIRVISEKAKRVAEIEAKEKIEKFKLEKQDAIEKANKSERDKIAAEEREKIRIEVFVKSELDMKLAADRAKENEEIAKIEAEKRMIEAKAKAKIDEELSVAKARQDEVDRQEAEKAEEIAAIAAREANRQHVSGILKGAKEALMTSAEIDEPTAKAVVLSIKNGKIPAISIKF